MVEKSDPSPALSYSSGVTSVVAEVNDGWALLMSGVKMERGNVEQMSEFLLRRIIREELERALKGLK